MIHDALPFSRRNGILVFGEDASWISLVLPMDMVHCQTQVARPIPTFMIRSMSGGAFFGGRSKDA